MRLRNRDTTPPDNFRFVHSETGYTSRRMEYANWIRDINDHCKANNLPPVTAAEAEHQLCQTLVEPEWCTQSRDDNSVPVSTRLTFDDIVEGAKVYIRVLLGMQTFVEQTEAERRAKVCSNCYFNVNVQGCGACAKLATLITGDVAQRSTKQDANLRACSVCKCPLRSIVHFPMGVLMGADSAENQTRYPAFCWRKSGGENYIPA